MRLSTRSSIPLPAFLALLAALTLLVAACGVSDGDREATTTGQETEEPVDVGPETAEMALERVAVGTALQDDGSIAVGQHSREFTVGDTVHVSFELDPAAPATEVELVWYGPDGLEVDSDVAVPTPDQTHVPFATGTTGWPPGTYRGEVWYGNELVEELEIEVVADSD